MRWPASSRQHLVVIVRIEQRIGRIAVPVRPSIDCNGHYVAPPGKPARSQHAVKLVADALLEIGKSHAEQAGRADAELAARVEAGIGRPRHVLEMQHYRLVRLARVPIAPETDRKVERNPAMK